MAMPRFVKVIISIASLLVLLVVAIYLWPRDVVELKFATYSQAMAEGALENGARRLIPKSATDIRSSSNFDSNSAIVTFKFGPEFEKYISQQKSVQAKSASELGFLFEDSAFSDPRELTYIPKINPDGETNQGSLLVNRSKGMALYFE